MISPAHTIKHISDIVGRTYGGPIKLLLEGRKVRLRQIGEIVMEVTSNRCRDMLNHSFGSIHDDQGQLN